VVARGGVGEVLGRVGFGWSDREVVANLRAVHALIELPRCFRTPDYWGFQAAVGLP
jgi:hypothetical protein